MPRLARVKSETSIYHIMIRSISEIQLFNERSDKLKYFSLIKKYQLKYEFKIYAYCLLDNHGHMILDCNGADVSTIMHGINLSYAMYFNRKYKRHGHVFQDRFKSKIIDSDRYLSTVCAYIHANSKDVVNSNKKIVTYEFSSLREYVNRTNTYELLNKEFLMNVINLSSKKGLEGHLQKVCSEKINLQIDGEFENEGSEYRGYRKILIRRINPLDIIDIITKHTGNDRKHIFIKHKSKYTHIRALACFLMSCFANIKQKDICNIIGNITQSRVSELSNLGVELVFKNKAYYGILDKFLVKS